MELHSLVKRHRDVIINKWFQYIIAIDGNESTIALNNTDNRFENPVGFTIRNEIEVIFDQLLSEETSPVLVDALSNIIKIRAVQDISPVESVSFILLLKKVVREELISEIKKRSLFEELLSFENDIDEILLRAFDLFIQCRDNINVLRIKELKKSHEINLRILQLSDGI